jgi:hypothetical protein
VSTSRRPTERLAASSTRSFRYATDSGDLRIRSTAPARIAATASSNERRGVRPMIIDVGDAVRTERMTSRPAPALGVSRSISTTE